MFYTGGRCDVMFKYVFGPVYLVYTLTIAVEPYPIDSTSDFNARNVTEHITDTIQRKTALNNFFLIGISSFVKANTGIKNILHKMSREERTLKSYDVKFVAIQIHFIKFSIVNISDGIGEIYDIVSNMNSEDKFHLRNISTAQFRRSNAQFHNKTIDTDVALSADLPGWLGDGLRYGYDNENGHAILPLNLSTSSPNITTTFTVVPEPSCPRVIIHVGEAGATLDNEYLHFEGLGKLSRTDLLISENGDYVSVCYRVYLSMVKEDQSDSSVFMSVLLTIICASLSLLCLTLTLITYCLSPSLRTVPGLNNMALVSSLMVFMFLTLVNACTDDITARLCRAVGIALHFALLSSFGWMFVCTFHMCKAFMTIEDRSVRFGNHNIFTIYAVLVESVAAIIIVATIIVSHVITDGESLGYTEHPCFVGSDTIRYNVAIPIGLIVLLDFAMYIYVVVLIRRTSSILNNSPQKRNNIIIFIKLSTITGMTWVFAFVHQLTNIDAFSYIFTVLNASQGVFIMLSFIANKRGLGQICLKGKQKPRTLSTKL